MNDLVIVDAELPQPMPSILGVSHQTMMLNARSIAKELTTVLVEAGLTHKLGAGEQRHVAVEGWQLAGSMLGLAVREVGQPIEHGDGSFSATVELWNPHTRQIIAVATGYCGKDEKGVGYEA